MEPGLLLPKARVGGYPVSLAQGLILNIYDRTTICSRVSLCQLCVRRVCLILASNLVITRAISFRLAVRLR